MNLTRVIVFSFLIFVLLVGVKRFLKTVNNSLKIILMIDVLNNNNND